MVEFRPVTTWLLRWDPTDYFDRVLLGHNDDEHVEITETEAQQFVERITAKLS